MLKLQASAAFLVLLAVACNAHQAQPYKRQGTVPAAAATGVPPLANITSGMPSRATIPITATFSPGASPSVKGVPPLPTFVFKASDWPTPDKVPPTDSPEVNKWMKELDGFTIPDIPPTAINTCAGDPTAASQAAQRGWWTCGGYIRVTDYSACPDKLTWGVSFDDGPAPYTQYLLNYLTDKKIIATFYVVGSRVVQFPNTAREEYMTGHELSVHTWSHHPLTTLTTPQVVAELGWTRKAIKAVTGVTPTTMRPPYGDVDDRIRAISMAMGMNVHLWTRTPAGVVFDTNDWKVPGGIVNGTDSFAAFNSILGNATQLDTGFIVLQHDLYEASVDLATGYTLNAAQTHNPPFTLKSVGECLKIPTQDLYLESNTNKSFPFTNHTKKSGAEGPIQVVSGPIAHVVSAFVVGLAGLVLV